MLATVGIGYSREYRAQAAAAALQARVRARARVLRDGASSAVPTEEVVPGDVVLLSAGSLVPADAVVLEATDCFVSEAVLTGESFPVEKRPGAVAARRPRSRERTNCVFLGTNVRSGTARCLVVAHRRGTPSSAPSRTGSTLRPPETEFDRGIRRFGYLLTSAMLVMVLVVFAVHVLRGRPPVETLLFSVALAVGLSPELLPAILSVNLARGAQMMARHGVLVRRLNAIENLGSMDVLCTDKTGTLTEGVVRLEGAYDADGAPSRGGARARPRCNAALETGLASPLDEAILAARTPDLTGAAKAGRDPVRLRAQARQRRRASGRRRVAHHQGRVPARARGLHAPADGTPLDDGARARSSARYRRLERDRASACSRSRRGPIDAQRHVRPRRRARPDASPAS